MKNYLLFLATLFLLSSHAYAVEYTVNIVPATGSVGDNEVSIISTTKIDGLNSALDNKASISSLGSLAWKISLLPSDIPDLSSSKITGLGPWATRVSPTILSTEITDLSSVLSSYTKTVNLGALASKNSLAVSDIPTLTSSKISDLAATISSALSAYLSKSDIPNCASNQYLSQVSGILTCVTKNESVHISANYTATTSVENIFVNTSAATRTITLPDASTMLDKRYNLVLEAGSTNPVVIVASGANKICDHTQIKLTGLNDSVEIQSNGANWIALHDSCSRTISGSVGGPNAQGGEGGNCPGNSSCSIWRQLPKGSVLGASSNAAGNIAVAFQPGTFSEAANCTCSGVSWGVAFRACYPIISIDGVNLVVTSANEGSGLVGAANYICHGIR